MKNPYKIGDVIRVTRSCEGFYDAGAIGTVCVRDFEYPDENADAVWVDFNHPDNTSPIVGDGIWSVGVDQGEVVSSKFTVILLRPEYLADNYGQDTYMLTVEARDPASALKAARERVIEGDNDDVAEFLQHHELTDYYCIAVIAGEHQDINPEL